MTRRSDHGARPPQPNRGRVPFGGRIILFAAAAGMVLVLLAYHAFTWRSFTTVIGVCQKPFCDFVDFYYPMGAAVFDTGLPVRGFLYSPFVAILLAAFPPLGLTASLVVWGVLQALFLTVYLLMFRWLVPSGLPIQLLFVALTLSSFPLPLNFLGGSVSFFMMAALLGLLVLYGRGHRAAASVLLAFAASFKFYPLMFLAPFLARRDTRFLVFGAAACGALLLMVPGVLLGTVDTLRFYGGLLDSFRHSDWVVTNVHSQYFPHVVRRLAAAAGYDASAHLALLRWIAWGVTAANVGLLFLVQRARLRHADLWSFQILFMTVPFVLKTSWASDFVFLPFTQTLLVWWLVGERRRIRGRMLRRSVLSRAGGERGLPPRAWP